MEFFNAIRHPLNRLATLSFFLAIGFVLVLLAGIQGSWLPVADGVIFGVAYLPRAVSKIVTTTSDYDLNFEPSASMQGIYIRETCQFITAFLTITALYLPFVLKHSHIITPSATVLTLVGGSIIFSTVYMLTLFFISQDEEDTLDDINTAAI